MAYALAPHIDRWWSEPAFDADAHAQRLYALIDAGQLQAVAARKWLSHTASVPLFKNCFAEAALDLSPALIALDTNREAAFQLIEEVDAHCRSLPIAALLSSKLTEARLVLHLQQRLRMEADGALYLLRLADTQMLRAAAQCFTSDQVAGFFDEIDHWWATDHQGECVDLVPTDRPPQTAPMPLKFDGKKTVALLDSAAVPMTDARLGRYDPNFASLPHSRRTALLHQWHFAFGQTERESDDEDFMTFAVTQWTRCPDRCKGRN